MLFYEKLRQLASEKHMTQVEIARRSGMSKSRINMIWNGHVNDPRLETVMLLAEALDVPIGSFLEDIEFPRD